MEIIIIKVDVLEIGKEFKLTEKKNPRFLFDSIRPNRGRGNGGGRGGNKTFTRGRGNGRNNNRKNNNTNFTKETLDNELEKYMAQTKIDNDSIQMNTI